MALVVTGIITVGVVLSRRRERRKREGIDFACGLLEDSVRAEGASEVSGHYDGLDVTIRYVVRGSGSSSTQWTEIDVSHGLEDVTLELSREGWQERRSIARGRTLDLQTGHAEFDAAFVVEGAPAEVIELALNESICARLMAIADSQRGAVRPLEPKVLRLEVMRFLFEAEAIEEHVDLATELAQRLREAHAQVDQSVTVEGAYRGGVQNVSAARSERRAEVARVRDLRTARSLRTNQAGCVFITFVAVFCIAVVASAFWH